MAAIGRCSSSSNSSSSSANIAPGQKASSGPGSPAANDGSTGQEARQGERKASGISLQQSKEILSQANDLTAKARLAQAEAEGAVATIKEAASTLERSIQVAQSTTTAFSDSIEQQWKAFQAKFDEMNKLAFRRLEAVMGVAPSGLRKSELISEARVAQVLRRARNLVVLTGAGISAESGIPTFRGADGFWTIGSKNYQPQDLATWEKYDEMPSELWRWYQYRWGICLKAKPNPGHFAVAELQKLVEGSYLLVTQNVDGLHLQAGSDAKRLAEIHGRLDEMRCDERVEGACLHQLDLNAPETLAKARATIEKTPKPAKNQDDERLPICKKCGVRQRPKILWFDETYNEAFFKWKTVMKKMEECDVLLIIGTQLTTGGPSSMVRTARGSGAIIIRIDPEVDLNDPATAGMLHLQGKSGECLPRIVRELASLRQEPLLAPLAPCAGSGAGSLSPETSKSSSSAASGAVVRGASSPAASGAVVRGASSPAVQRKATASSAASGTSSTSSRAAKGALQAAASASLGQSVSTWGAHPHPQSTASGSAGGRMAQRSGRTASKALPNATSATPDTAAAFFVYGTLRPDDDSGASWTQSFNAGMEAEVAFLVGASLYIDGQFPAVCLEKTRCSVRGTLLTPSQGLLAEKLAEADKIEVFPDLYMRTIVTVLLANGQARSAYVYHRTGKFDRSSCVRLADGDWLSRKRQAS